ncbi:73_t:CDS:2 [Diversispora eburnea]|uniref:73_t:CDS:1 n=1 Tax=Diversispora eburnea TaxID=1213867 RepID=A0A9N9CAN9_9GLOM|nr:73_t:CDS:2 [Diversispora eburnea]
MVGNVNNSEVYVADAELSSKERDQKEVQETLDERNAVPLARMKLKVLDDNDDDDEKKESRYNLRSNKRKNHAEDTLSVDEGLDTMVWMSNT